MFPPTPNSRLAAGPCRFRSWMALLLLAAVAASDVRLAADPQTTSLIPWVINGPVRGSVRLGDTLYVGGDFTAVAPSVTALPPVYALSGTSGSVVPPVFPSMDADVGAVEPDGNGGYFIGGSFTIVGAFSQPYLAHIRADGSFDQGFRPSLASPVLSLARLGSSLFVAATFPASSGGGGVGAVSTADGARLPWYPSPGTANKLIVAADAVVIYSSRPGAMSYPIAAVGAFDATSGAQRWFKFVAGGLRQIGYVSDLVHAGQHVIVATNERLWRLALANGEADLTWDPQVTAEAIALSGSTLYLGGWFTSVAGQPRQNLAAIDVETAALLPWNPDTTARVTRMAVTNSGTVYVSGPFTTIHGEPRHRLAQVDVAGTVTPWQADARPDEVFALLEGPGDTLLVASSLAATSNVARLGLAAFDLTTGALQPWAPALGPVQFLAGGGDSVWAGVSGATFVFDAISGALVDFFGNTTAFFADDRWIYWVSWPSSADSAVIERAELRSGARDSSWRPLVFVPDAVAVAGEVLFFASSTNGLAAVDRRTARTLWRNPSAGAREVAISGDTRTHTTRF